MPWSEVLGSLKEFVWIPVLLVFVVLPYLYCTLAIDVHKDYADLVKSAPVNFRFEGPTVEHIENDLHIFDLDWWIVIAITTLFVGLFSLGTLANTSSNFLSTKVDNPVAASPGTEGPQWAQVTRASQCRTNQVSDEHVFVRSMLVAYATLVGLLLSFLLVWARLRAARRLRTYYLHFRLSIGQSLCHRLDTTFRKRTPL